MGRVRHIGKRNYCTIDKRLCFRYLDSQSLFYVNRTFKPIAYLCDCKGRFVSELVGNPNCWFSHVKAQIKHQIQHFKYNILNAQDLFLSHVGSETPLSLQFAVPVCVTVQIGLCRSWSKTVCVSSYKVKALSSYLYMQKHYSILSTERNTQLS